MMLFVGKIEDKIVNVYDAFVVYEVCEVEVCV